jgi:hypothetical protein
MDNVQVENGSVEMECQGTFGTVKGLKGIQSCLKVAPEPGHRRRKARIL